MEWHEHTRKRAKVMIEVGQTFGKYRLVERIATGGMAEIFKAAVRGADGQ